MSEQRPDLAGSSLLPATFGDRPMRSIVPPEGVPLQFEIAPVGDRVLAFIIDAFFIGLAVVAIALLGTLAAGDPWLQAFAIFGVFFVIHFYFIGFEIRRQGSTPGKRALGLRVIDRHGGSLRAEAVFARNLMRQVELIGPLLVTFAPESLWPSSPGWLRVLALLWLLVLALLPWFNRDRLRLGDLLGGTLVVRTPRSVLLAPLEAKRKGGAVREPRYRFSAEQLDLYGVFELQVLESVLRKQRRQPRALRVVSEKIQRKIGWESSGGPIDPLEFLEDFYTAQRARLESDLLLGKRREFKKKGRLTRSSRRTSSRGIGEAKERRE